ncbi:hypothetical protein [Endozoicomonas arenosclerae]|uniref:hypothetical protein n=1 Tax=Endozoicomonas arenosclerae TaxID=1633495 RepID=UPI0007810DC9|nr:hypothetical protein [Endozoicomonas arenosclerae]
MIDDQELFELSKKFMADWLDKDYMILPMKLKRNGWECLPIADFINPMEAEWVSSAIQKNIKRKIISIAFEFEGRTTCSVFETSKEKILELNVKYSNQYLCLTSIDFEFIYFKDQLNRFYIISGDHDFLRESYPCTLETLKEMYFDWLDSDLMSDAEKTFLKNIWDKYLITFS